MGYEPGEWGKMAMLECLVYNRGLAVLEVMAANGVLGGLPPREQGIACSELALLSPP